MRVCIPEDFRRLLVSKLEKRRNGTTEFLERRNESQEDKMCIYKMGMYIETKDQGSRFVIG